MISILRISRWSGASSGKYVPQHEVWAPAGLTCCLGRDLGLLRARPEVIDPRFLLHAWREPSFQQTLRSRAIGSTAERIPFHEIGDLPLRLPPPDQQRARAAFNS